MEMILCIPCCSCCTGGVATVSSHRTVLHSNLGSQQLGDLPHLRYDICLRNLHRSEGVLYPQHTSFIILGLPAQLHHQVRLLIQLTA